MPLCVACIKNHCAKKNAGEGEGGIMQIYRACRRLHSRARFSDIIRAPHNYPSAPRLPAETPVAPPGREQGIRHLTRDEVALHMDYHKWSAFKGQIGSFWSDLNCFSLQTVTLWRTFFKPLNSSPIKMSRGFKKIWVLKNKKNLWLVVYGLPD